MKRTNSASSPGFRMKQLPFSAYTDLTKSGSSEPAATTIGICMSAGVDLMTLKTSNPETLGSERSRKIRFGTGALANGSFRSMYERASCPSDTQRNPPVNPADSNAARVRNVSAGLLCTTRTSICLSDVCSGTPEEADTLNIFPLSFPSGEICFQFRGGWPTQWKGRWAVT